MDNIINISASNERRSNQDTLADWVEEMELRLETVEYLEELGIRESQQDIPTPGYVEHIAIYKREIVELNNRIASLKGLI